MKSLVIALVAVVALTIASSAEAGPLRRLASRVRHPFRGGCAAGSCTSPSWNWTGQTL